MRRLLFPLAASLAACAASGTPPDAAAVPATDAATDVRYADLALLDRASAVDVITPTPTVDASATDAAPPLDAPTDDCTRFGGAACFLPPSGPVRTNRGALKLSCRETPPAFTTAPSVVRVDVTDFATRAPVERALVELAPTDAFAPGTVAATTADDDGFARLVAPVGTPSRAFWRVTHPDFLPTYSTAARLDVTRPDNIVSTLAISAALVSYVRERVGLPPAPGATGTIATEADDCDGHALANVVITLSSTSSTVAADAGAAPPPTFVPSAKVFYFNDDATSSPAPRARLTATSTNGTAAVVDVPTTTPGQHFYLQAWGQRADGPLRLMGETPVRSIAGAVVLAEMQPYR